MKARAAEENTDFPIRFADRFSLHEQIGRGGMAVVYRATDTVNQEQLAIKECLRVLNDA